MLGRKILHSWMQDFTTLQVPCVRVCLATGTCSTFLAWDVLKLGCLLHRFHKWQHALRERACLFALCTGTPP